MSLNFSANQYNKAYNPYNLQNWELPREHRERPRQNDGFTQFIANNKGHLVNGVPRSRGSPWGQFVGTWDLPIKIPGNKLNNPTARCPAVADSLLRMKAEGDEVIKGQTKHVKVPDPLPIREDNVTGIPASQSKPLALEKPPTPARCICPTPPPRVLSPADNSLQVDSSKTPIHWPASPAAKH